MSRTTRIFECTPEDVFDVLADGWSYSTWVVGAARIRDVDTSWPDPGSEIHHSVGAWPLLLSDSTSVISVDAPHHLELKVRAWPAGEGVVRLTLTPHERGTEVVMEEDASAGPATLLLKPLRDPVLHLRNIEALRRLAYLAESRARLGGTEDDAGDVAQVRPEADHSAE
ncbi:SRPBCC family protein [Nocardioides sp. zg-536]|uniref:SRPBCC family protein n=1 Tax=Nocardioides faecalis TaxID=2803858 RepID=A0A939BWG4_9ACTN|nr:SRPBCC family protein [Nocardioides faecalis]MBM9461006.1 SRPBCC family protein [Nocardioides faecalis]QVI59102.1 SRPBCC family protein [Nocardioides faecalis]